MESNKFSHPNVEGTVKGNILTLVIDLSKELGLSRSGKSNNIATTSGNKPIPDSNGAVIGLNIYRAVKS